MDRFNKRKKFFDGDSYESYSPKRAKQEDLEVTGVSRSGRVRKKSSKLTDFESPDEIDNRYKRRERGDMSPMSMGSGQQQMALQRGRKPAAYLEPPHQVNIKVEPQQDLSDSDGGDDYGIKQEPCSSDSDSDGGMMQPDVGDDFSSMDSMGSDDDDDLDDDVMDEHGSELETHRDASDSTPSQAQSLYMLEKSSKKKLIIKDGKIVGRMKAQRKDKGKTRFTAYMLWAKEIRQEIARGNPEMDFSTMSRRLGELWATVPNNEKYNWKRRAKRLAVKGNRESTSSIDTTRWKVPPSRSKFINRASGRPPGNKPLTPVPTMVSAPPVSTNLVISPTETKASKPGLVTEPMVGPGLYKVVGTQPVDVAAHLKLLGESLTIIGERLKEHDGQIAVSGSISVLLDSFLCAVGPLMCLVQQHPLINGCPQDTLNKILDNIAYFMPGL
ncbi:HMG box-containing protein 4 isoform X2 [Bacillus rossius redtenbacheri]|uniref:HMG box-containing protein 4 isoform X2 n=1 Tax=Bacillus rossius redtenbacheri TaxID=93214 RepID=UPI002FDE6490